MRLCRRIVGADRFDRSAPPPVVAFTPTADRRTLRPTCPESRTRAFGRPTLFVRRGWIHAWRRRLIRLTSGRAAPFGRPSACTPTNPDGATERPGRRKHATKRVPKHGHLLCTTFALMMMRRTVVADASYLTPHLSGRRRIRRTCQAGVSARAAASRLPTSSGGNVLPPC